MNMREFATLKLGDKVENLAFGAGSVGEVVAVEGEGIRVVWGPRHDYEARFFYHVNSTAWKHWTRIAEPDAS